MSLYLMCVYNSPEQEAWLRSAWAKSGKKLDMGKSCVRFKKVEDLALDVIGEAFRRMRVKDVVAQYEASLARAGARQRPASKKTVKKAAEKSAPGTRKKAAERQG